MANILHLMPDLEPDEMNYVQSLVNPMSDEEAMQFATIYRNRRREPMLILITTIIGFFGVAGIQRFLIGNIGMGLLYFFTAGLCFIGTIVDLINYRRLAYEYNVKEAQQVVAMMRY
ncbi:TM2 domain-containing membrane protein YozV [Pontibacter aydingkolensis]|uniref:TM2 domain-containing protein n=1 Tax=Pontibacter aydingkolensis TaxID=1911536 RepID=A0ABS7CPN7_9BACT|nr:TM2 domain-containing protein [Pontibacter aydingkolensis]MBW7465817.1 TM2 domain-containing protein [Pontibacter aydingkolensis]